MPRLRSWLPLCCVLIVASVAPLAPAVAPPDAGRFRGADAAARRIDRHLAAAWKKAGAEPARDAGDHEFVRRVYLDLAGRIPTVSETRRYLADRRSDRRTRLVEQLLNGPRFVAHQTTVWRTLLLPEAGANFALGFQTPSFERWLATWLESGRGFDAMVKELVTQPVGGGQPGAFVEFGGQNSSPRAFFAAKEFQPAEISGAVSRAFLGINLSCAQCHNHPFANWKREQSWAFTAFFAGIAPQRQGDNINLNSQDKSDAHEILIPNTDKKVKARFLDGKQPTIKAGMKAREVLADWIVSKDNPYFAKAIVNRVWAQLFGTGLVEPLDEMSGTEAKASHPELLDELARDFATHDFNLAWLIRTITATRAYQFSSARTSPSQDDPHLFARMQVRGLTPEQLFDSVATATGYQGNAARREFLTKFANSADRPTEVQTSLLQALALMNGRLTAEATSLERSETLAAIVDSPFMSTSAKVEALYLAGLARKPTVKETSRLVRYVEAGGVSTAKDRATRQAEALADVFWALLNSAEFKFNH